MSSQNRHRSRARYVQRYLEQETGKKPSYSWLLTRVDLHLDAAISTALRDDRATNDVLVDLIRPENREHQTQAERAGFEP